MSAFKCFESYAKDKDLQKGHEQYILKCYSSISYRLKGVSVTG